MQQMERDALNVEREQLMLEQYRLELIGAGKALQ